MKYVCAWCGEDLEGREARSTPNGRLSHGICKACSTKLWQETGTPIGDFLESLEVPTFLVDEDGRIRAASAITMGWLEKDQQEVEGQLGGDVFDCINANLPGGCGQTEHCSACTVRQTVTDTYSTGVTHLRVPASLEVMDGEGSREILFYLTTRKVGARVMVQIEPPT